MSDQPEMTLDIPNFQPIEPEDRNFAEALKYELLGLRQEMQQYMHHQFLVENFSLTAAAVSFTYMLSINSGAESTEVFNETGDGPGFTQIVSGVYYTSGDLIKAVFLAAVTLFILYFGLERVKLLRYRISRLGLYIYMREKCYPDRYGWEHFVYDFRNVNFTEITTSYQRASYKDGDSIKASELNRIIETIDKSPGSFTSKQYTRWWIIMAIAALGCASQVIYILFQIPELFSDLEYLIRRIDYRGG